MPEEGEDEGTPYKKITYFGSTKSARGLFDHR